MRDSQFHDESKNKFKIKNVYMYIHALSIQLVCIILDGERYY